MDEGPPLPSDVHSHGVEQYAEASPHQLHYDQYSTVPEHPHAVEQQPHVVSEAEIALMQQNVVARLRTRIALAGMPGRTFRCCSAFNPHANRLPFRHPFKRAGLRHEIPSRSAPSLLFRYVFDDAVACDGLPTTVVNCSCPAREQRKRLGAGKLVKTPSLVRDHGRHACWSHAIRG
jgi:hypothetical protein